MVITACGQRLPTYNLNTILWATKRPEKRPWLSSLNATGKAQLLTEALSSVRYCTGNVSLRCCSFLDAAALEKTHWECVLAQAAPELPQEHVLLILDSPHHCAVFLPNAKTQVWLFNCLMYVSAVHLLSSKCQTARTKGLLASSKHATPNIPLELVVLICFWLLPRCRACT